MQENGLIRGGIQGIASLIRSASDKGHKEEEQEDEEGDENRIGQTEVPPDKRRKDWNWTEWEEIRS